MTVRKLVDTARASTSVSATVCVVGAGIAGLTAATRLARDRRVRVVIVESGVETDDPDTAALDRIDNPARNYDGNRRARGLGGTSLAWDGKLLPISKGEVAQRPWLDVAHWPFDVAELDRFTAEIETMMDVDRASYEEDVAALLDASGQLPRGDADFVQRWPKRPKPADRNIAHLCRKDIKTRANLDIWLGATVSSFVFDPHNGRLRSIVAIDRHGHSLTVTADEFLIAAGALESTRLLLVADRDSGGMFCRDGDALGHYFNDHLGLDVATVRPKDPRRTNLAFADRWTLGASRHLHFELTPSAQQAGQIGSAYFDFGVEVPDRSALTQTRLAMHAARHRRAVASTKSALAAAVDFPTLFNTALWRYRARHMYWPANAVVQIKIRIEQLPHRRNRIVLSDSVDALGQPLMRFEFHKTDDEERAFRFTVDKLRDFWAREFAGITTLDWIPAVDDPDALLVDLSVEQAHPAGSTRMGTNPATSVVDPSLRAHAVPNLSVASASVFPTSGSANPTLTVMQLAMRAADAISGRLSRYTYSPTEIASTGSAPQTDALRPSTLSVRSHGRSTSVRPKWP